jgi:schlafen family protein
MTPVYIRTVEDLDAVVKIGVTKESLVLEFKGKIDWDLPTTNGDDHKRKADDHKRRAKAQQETCRDIAQFANTSGGSLLIGVKERLDPASGLKLAIGFERVNKPDGMKAWIEEAIKNYLVPATFAHPIEVLSDPARTVVVVNVPPSIHLVALWHSERKSQFEEKHSIEYLYRDSHGKKWMNPDEVERHIMNGSRATKLAFDAAWTQASVKEVYLVGGYWRRGEGFIASQGFLRVNLDAPVTVGRVDHQWFELLIPTPSNTQTQSLNLPFGLVEQVWVGSDRRVHLLLSVRVVRGFDGGFTVERYD